MARFQYNGEPERSMVVEYGACTVVKVPLKNGTVQALTPIAPATEFAIDADIGYEITDQRALACLRADSRFTEL